MFGLLAIPVDLFEGLVQILALTGTAGWVGTKAVVAPLKTLLVFGGLAIALAGCARWSYQRRR